MRIIFFCVRRPVSVVTAAAGILLFGSVSFLRLKVELLPSLRIPFVRVVTEYGGMPAEEIESLVTKPLENALSSVKGLKGIESVSKEEVSGIGLRFDWTTDIRVAAAETREKVDAAYPYLPDGAGRPLVSAEDMNSEPIIVLAAVPAPGRSFREAGGLVRRELASRLARVPGVSSVRVIGAEEPEILVETDRERLLGAGLSTEDIAEITASAVVDHPVGKIVEGGREYLVKASGGIETPEELGALPLAAGGSGAALRLGDVARISERSRDASSFFLVDGRRSIGIFLGKTAEAGSLAAARAVSDELPLLEELFARDLRITLVRDATEEIASALSGLLLSVGLGIGAVFVVLLLTFGRPDHPLVVASSIPLCCAAAFLFMYFRGMTLNIVSLSGMALGAGMIVDNGIVVLENMLRLSNPDREDIAGAAAKTAAAIFPSTVTTILVFLPIGFIPGIIGALFSDLASVLSFLLAASFVFSLTLTPALFVLMPASRDGRAAAEGRAEKLYRRYLAAAFRRPLIPGLLLLFLAAGGAALFRLLPLRVMPERDPGLLEMTAAFPPGTRLEETLRESETLSRKILSVPGVRRVFAEAGFDAESPSDRGRGGRNPWTSRFTILIAERSSADTRRDLDAVLGDGIRRETRTPENATSRLLGAREGFDFRLSGGNREEMLERAAELTAGLKARGLAVGASSDTEKNQPRIAFRLDEAAAAFHRISAREVLEALKTSVRGRIPAALPRGDEEIDIRVRTEGIPGETEPTGIPIRVGADFIKAGGLGVFERGFSYPELHRADRKDSVTLHILPVPGAERKLEEALASDASGRLLSRSGLATEAGSAASVFALAVLLMYLMLAAQFESPAIPLLLLLFFPLSAAGSFLLLLALGYSLNLNSFLGILILLGTTINSPILLTAAYGGGGTETIIRESVLKLKPLAATVNTTLTALLPILLDRSGENILQSNTAAALAGGLAAGTAAVLLVYPPLFGLAFRRSRG